jgi:hypothetical protein
MGSVGGRVQIFAPKKVGWDLFSYLNNQTTGRDADQTQPFNGPMMRYYVLRRGIRNKVMKLVEPVATKQTDSAALSACYKTYLPAKHTMVPTTKLIMFV